MTRYLPPELTDRVVDHLHDDPRALSSCALTSRILLSAARYHQFGTIILNSDRITLFNALLDKDPSLGYSVSKILLASRFWTHLWHPNANELRIAIERTPACRHIEIWHIQFLENSQVITQLIAGTKNLQIESLRIYDVHFFCGFDELPWLISSLPYLQDLTLDSICSKDTGEDSSKLWEVHKPPSRLTALTTGTINENGVHNICSWLGKAKPSFVLHSYNLEIVDYSSAYFGTQVLTHFGQTISDLSVKVDCDLNVPYVLDKVGLTVENGSSLRHLHISFHLRDMFVKENQSLQWITILISQISSPIIETITITIYADEVQFHDLRALDSECGVRELLLVKFEDMTALNWEVINDLLSEKFRSLNRLSLKGRGPWDTFKAYIESYYQSIAHLVVLDASDSENNVV
ncbi:hypothetical protein ABKN59_008258 [Abortiporus biennis]